MATDNTLLLSRKQRYKVVNFKTKEVYAEGFTSQKSAMQWRKENISKDIDCYLVCYKPTVR